MADDRRPPHAAQAPEQDGGRSDLEAAYTAAHRAFMAHVKDGYACRRAQGPVARDAVGQHRGEDGDPVTAPAAPAPDPRDPASYYRGDRWPGETLLPLTLSPDELEQLTAGLAVVVALAWGDVS